MYLKLTQLKSRRVLLIVLALTIAITAVTASAAFWRRAVTPEPALTTGPAANTPVSQGPKQLQPNPNLTLLPIHLRERGFTSSEFTATAGNFELLIINFSGEPDLTFQLEREHERGQKPDKFNSQKGKPLKKKFHLKPGVYRLTVLEHPDWVCRLNITES